MESNWSHSTVKTTTNPCPSPCATFTHLLNPSTGDDSTTGLGSLCQSWRTLSLKKLFPDVQPKSLLRKLKTVSPHVIPCSVGAEPNLALLAPSCQGVVQSKKVLLEPPFLHTESPRFFSCSLSNVLQTIPQHHYPSLDMQRRAYTRYRDQENLGKRKHWKMKVKIKIIYYKGSQV